MTAGRPPIYDVPLRIRTVKFTDDQWERLGALASEEGTSRAGLLRAWIDNRSPPAPSFLCKCGHPDSDHRELYAWEPPGNPICDHELPAAPDGGYDFCPCNRFRSAT